LSSILPESRILINAPTAKLLGLKDEGRVKIGSATNPEGVWNLPNRGEMPMIGRLQTLEGMQPNTIGASSSFYDTRVSLVKV
jgi:hypothetical protein